MNADKDIPRKNRTTITREIIKFVRRDLQKELKLAEIASVCDISYAAARILVGKISDGLSDEEILKKKKGDQVTQMKI